MLNTIRRLPNLILNKKPSSYKQIDSLDGLRGIAVLLVLVSHLSNNGLHLIAPLSFSGVGKVGVWLFFVLSSFLLTLQFLNKRNELLLSSKTWMNYFLRRFLRIYPLFAVVMIVSWILSGTDSFYVGFHMEGMTDLISRLLLQNAKGVEWSILVEFRYYFLLPVIVFLIAFPLRRNPLYVTSVTILVLFIADYTRPAISLTSLRPYIAVFFLGSFTGYLFWRFRDNLSNLSQGMRWAFETLALSVLVVCFVLTPSVYSLIIGQIVPLNYWHGDLTLFAVLWCVFIYSYMNGVGHIERLLSQGWLRMVGIVSFGLYLWHPPVIEYVKHNINANSFIQASAVLLISFTIACFTYLFIERPFLNIKPSSFGKR